ncbi:hypothetical protein C6988_09700 [Nitrosopumilus sp. b1]|nr:hypothetical protein C6988_09700 [Nitrosopumilus sp. b1]
MHFVYRVFAIIAIVIASFGISQAYSQELQFATFQEMGQVLIDQQISNNVTASITLQSTSNQEMKIPSDVEQKIRDNPQIISVILTNEERCILGVFDQACVLINVTQHPDWKGINSIQDGTRVIGDSLIDDINRVFDTNAEFHSVYIHHSDEANKLLDTSGVVSGRGTVSAVYVMPLEDTMSMYEKISSILIPKVIRDSGGFYENAKKMSSDSNASMTFSIIPRDNASLFQLKLSIDYPNAADKVSTIKPLEFLHADELRRSSYFSGGFYPLNSLLQVVILSPEPTNVEKVRGNLMDTHLIDGEKIPTDVTQTGWIFDPESGEKIEGKFLFGKESIVKSEDLEFTLTGFGGEFTEKPIIENDDVEENYESMIIVAIIAIVAIGAALYYLKGYRKSA